jgi:endonuclease/exonuclease/phosphatase family metal-dependent hydrolase
MRLATYNLRAGGSPGAWAAIRALEADLCFLQEARDPTARVTDLFAAPPAIAWSAVAHGRWGSALLSTGSLIEPIRVPGFEAWVTGGGVHGPAGEMLAFSVHIPAGPYVRQAGRLIDALKPLGGSLPMILAGDWNVAASRRAADDPIPFAAAEARILDRLEAELGLTSAWQAVHPGEPLAQTLRWTRQPTLPYHCDGIFVPMSWVPALDSAEVLGGDPWPTLSDHNPVVARIDPRRLARAS